mgnify:CR=1 FL=1
MNPYLAALALLVVMVAAVLATMVVENWRHLVAPAPWTAPDAAGAVATPDPTADSPPSPRLRTMSTPGVSVGTRNIGAKDLGKGLMTRARPERAGQTANSAVVAMKIPS